MFYNLFFSVKITLNTLNLFYFSLLIVSCWNKIFCIFVCEHGVFLFFLRVRTRFLFFFLQLQHHRRTGRQVQFEPLFLIFFIERVELGEVHHPVVDAAEAAEPGAVAVEYAAVTAARSKNAEALERACRVEIEDEYQIFAHER